MRNEDVDVDSDYKDIDSSDDGKDLIITKIARIRLTSNLQFRNPAEKTY